MRSDWWIACSLCLYLSHVHTVNVRPRSSHLQIRYVAQKTRFGGRARARACSIKKTYVMIRNPVKDRRRNDSVKTKKKEKKKKERKDRKEDKSTK